MFAELMNVGFIRHRRGLLGHHVAHGMDMQQLQAWVTLSLAPHQGSADSSVC